MITQSLKRQFLVFLQFLWRDLYIQSRFLKNYIINFTILLPVTFAISNAYLQTNTYFGAGNNKLGTTVFCGNVILICAIISFKLLIELFFDLTGKKFINYQITLLSPWLVLVERILYTALINFMVVLPLFPITKLVLGDNIDVSNTHWIKLIVTLLLIAFCCSAYHACALLIIRSPAQLTTIWSRFNNTFISLGGFFIPWFITNQYSSVLGKLNLLNPFVYMSEGIRQAIIGGPQFFNWWLSISMLGLFTLLLTLLSIYLFRRRTDCI